MILEDQLAEAQRINADLQHELDDRGEDPARRSGRSQPFEVSPPGCSRKTTLSSRGDCITVDDHIGVEVWVRHRCPRLVRTRCGAGSDRGIVQCDSAILGMPLRRVGRFLAQAGGISAGRRGASNAAMVERGDISRPGRTAARPARSPPGLNRSHPRADARAEDRAQRRGRDTGQAVADQRPITVRDGPKPSQLVRRSDAARALQDQLSDSGGR